MIYSNIEFITSVLFLAGLILVYNLRTVIMSYSKESYNYITAGLITITLCTEASLFSQLKQFDAIPFLNDLIFFQIVYWIGMITGMTLLLSGVSSWMPIFKKHQKFNSHELNKAELFKKIEQLIRFESRNNIILLQALELINKHYNFNEASCFLFSQNEKRMILHGIADKNTHEIKSHNIRFDNAAITDSIARENIELAYSTETENTSPDLVLPMETNKKLLGAFCFYTNQNLDDNSVANLKLVIDILTQKLYQSSKEIQQKAQSKQITLIETLESSIDSTKTLKENILQLKKILGLELSIDYLSISFAIQDKSPKITVSENNQILEDLSNSFTDENQLENYVTEMNIPVVIDNLDKETNFVVDLVALQNNMKSVVAFPITNKQSQTGVLVLGSKRYNAFKLRNMRFMEQFTNTLERLITNSKLKLNEKRELTRRVSMNELLKSVSTTTQTSVLYQRVTDLIRKELRASFARISTFDKDKRFLNSQALSCSGDFSFITPKDATMMLSLMPNHRNVLHTRNHITVKTLSEDSDQLYMEQRQIFGDRLSQYLIVPIMQKSMLVGTVTVGFSTTVYNITENDISFVEECVSMLAMHAHINNQDKLLKQMKKQMVKQQVIDMEEYHQKQNIDSSERLTKIFQNELVGN